MSHGDHDIKFDKKTVKEKLHAVTFLCLTNLILDYKTPFPNNFCEQTWNRQENTKIRRNFTQFFTRKLCVRDNGCTSYPQGEKRKLLIIRALQDMGEFCEKNIFIFNIFHEYLRTHHSYLMNYEDLNLHSIQDEFLKKLSEFAEETHKKIDYDEIDCDTLEDKQSTDNPIKVALANKFNINFSTQMEGMIPESIHRWIQNFFECNEEKGPEEISGKVEESNIGEKTACDQCLQQFPSTEFHEIDYMHFICNACHIESSEDAARYTAYDRCTSLKDGFSTTKCYQASS